ncbi:ECF transporter S component [Galactobacter caseinivorans]|uniref:Uncharacterized protein n=1 Tax=Galactobacter caseinivorans TaxID=2676123 RepID=A0A496PIE1_9MICC|nr:ECF transporter S component [Galactobacter caseinivorans]RKW70247.1 hypothetical protein DWQ67_09945 [Galactobacter caseinivorans]
MSATEATPRTPQPATSGGTSLRWRTVDIVIAAVLAVVGGVIFAIVNWTYHVLDPLFLGFPPSSGLITGLWLFPGVLAALVIRKPGAALFVEMVAAVISAIFGSSFGATVLLSGLVQGLGAELGAALLGRYRRFGLPVAIAAGTLTGFFGAVNDAFIMRWYPEYTDAWLWAYVACVSLSGLVIGILMWFVTRGLAATGVLGPLRSRGANRESVSGK